MTGNQKTYNVSIYMANVVTGTDTEPEALQYYTSSRNCFQKAGMNLWQWTSNSPALNRQAHDDRVYTEPMVYRTKYSYLEQDTTGYCARYPIHQKTERENEV